jgi:hypothetical protein
MNATMSASPTSAPSSLLSRVLVFDAVVGFGFGLLLLVGTGWLSPWLGLPATLLFPAGLLLLVFGTVISIAAPRPERNRGLVWAVIIGNLLWVDASLLVAFRWFEPTQAGLVIVLAQAVAVLALAVLEFIGLRRLPR